MKKVFEVTHIAIIRVLNEHIYSALKGLFILLLLFVANNVTAAIINGKITDEEGNPIVASIHVSEMKMGAFSNTDGFYQLKISSGIYDVDFLYPGYKTKSIHFEIKEDTTYVANIVMDKDSFSIPAIIHEKKDDQSGLNKVAQIVQQEIYNRNVLKSIKAEIYSKGSTNTENVYPIFKKAIQYTPFAFLSTHSKVFTEYIDRTEYAYPNSFSRKVEDINGNIPNPEVLVKMLDEMKSSFFLSKDQLFITPFTVNTIKYYHYYYEGSSINCKGETISKIRIKSKFSDSALFKGYVYINEHDWVIEQIDVSNLFYMIRVSWMKVNDKKIYLPGTIMVKSRMRIEGVDLDLKLYSSNKYTQIVMLDKESPVVQYKPFSTIDTYISSDSKKDSTYWTDKRHFPLTQNDSYYLSIQDSIASKIKADKKTTKSLKQLFSKKRLVTNSGKGVLTFDGLSFSLPEYNFVDGFVMGQHFYYKVNSTPTQGYEINPHIYYLTARHRFNGGVDFVRNYNSGTIKLSTGTESADFNPLGNRNGNTLSSILWGRNNSYFYKNDFVKINNDVSLTKNLKFLSGFTLQRRSGLENSTDFSILGKKEDIKPNIYSDAQFDKTAYWLGLEYVANNRAMFHAEYEQAFGGWQRNNSRYKKIKAFVTQQKELGIFSAFQYYFEGGTFLGNRNAHFADYNHFNASDSYVSAGSPFASYMLLGSYEASTNDYWFDLKLNYTNKYLLIKRIPFFQAFPFTESMHFKTLYTPQIKYHVELGYSVNFTRHINFGVFCSINHNNSFEKIALRFSYNLQAFRAELPKF